MTVSKRQWVLMAAVVGVAFASAAQAAEYTWTPTAAGTTYDWNAATSNWTSGFPSLAGDVANVNNDILGNQTIRLQQAISVGTLNIGDSNGSHTFGIASGTGTNILTFESTSAGDATYLNVGSTGTVTNTVAAGLLLGGTSSLTLNVGGTQILTLSGSTDVNGNTLTAGGAGSAAINFNGNVTGTGKLVVNRGASASAISLGSSHKDFTGDVEIHRGTLQSIGGSVRNAGSLTVNGYVGLSPNISSMGGVFSIGNNSGQATNPGQRAPAVLRSNGGTLSFNGQAASTATWTTVVQDNVSVLDLNSGFSLVGIGVGGLSGGTLIAVDTLERGAGASLFVRAPNLLGINGRMTVANISEHLKGAGGDAGATNMSIVPFIGSRLTNADGNNIEAFTTYTTATGLRPLTASEYSTSLGAGSQHNVKVSSVATATDVAVNSLHYTGGSTNMGAGRTITVQSGAVFISAGTGSIGAAGNAAAGTLNFNDTEAVIWTSTGTGVIGANITGTGGLTKAGYGTLVLAGTNDYSGLTVVSGGTLQVGNGTQNSILGSSGDVEVASGALLKLMNGAAIADDAALTLSQYGIFNGRIELAAGVEEQVAGLYFGTAQQAFGTWGATGSGATNINDTYFSGTGVLNVVAVPEPVTLSGFGLAFAALLRRQRRA